MRTPNGPSGDLPGELGVHNQSDAVNIPVYAEQYLHRILLSVRPIGYLE